LRVNGIDPNRAYAPKEIKTLLADGRREESALPVIKRIHKFGSVQSDRLHGFFERTINDERCIVEYEADPELRDAEQVPLLTSGGIEGFFDREVFPYSPDVWINEDATKIGYEVSFTRYFYKPKPMRSLKEIGTDIAAVKGKSERVIDEILVGSASDP
jgi:type I restriction enzyme M protein